MTTELHLAEPPKPGETQDPPASGGNPPTEVTAESLGVDQSSFEKFYDAEAKAFNWENYSKELAFKLAQSGKKAAAAPAGDAAPADTDGAGDDRQVAQSAGIDYDAMVAHLAEHGDIPEADRKRLNEAGFPDAAIDDHIQFRQQQAKDHQKTVIDAFGGDEGWKKAVEFVNENFDDEEIDSVNLMIRQPANYKAAVALIQSRMGGAPAPSQNGVVHAPNAGTPATADAKPFESVDEFNAAFRDPKYQTDPTFRAEVMARARVTDIRMNPRSHTAGL